MVGEFMAHDLKLPAWEVELALVNFDAPAAARCLRLLLKLT